jgi:uncharacterized protein YjbJ (UPF0337 family)
MRPREESCGYCAAMGPRWEPDTREENCMVRDVIKSHWPRLQGKLRSKWNRLTYEDVSFTEGDRDYLVGRLRERYGLDEAAAKTKVAQFERMLS